MHGWGILPKLMNQYFKENTATVIGALSVLANQYAQCDEEFISKIQKTIRTNAEKRQLLYSAAEVAYADIAKRLSQNDWSDEEDFAEASPRQIMVYLFDEKNTLEINDIICNAIEHALIQHR